MRLSTAISATGELGISLGTKLGNGKCNFQEHYE